MKRCIAILCACLAISALQAQPRLSPDNVDAVLAAMTLEEKATLLVGANQGVLFGGDPSEAVYDLPASAGIYDNRMAVGGSTYGFARLGITNVVMADGPAGLRLAVKHRGEEGDHYCTAFPVATALASSWNTELLRSIGDAMGEEADAYGVDLILAPALNIHRNPLCGRNFEYYSEDPLVSGLMAAAMVSGIQGRGVGTSAKHFAANSQETNRKDNDVIISTRALREIYLKGFEILVREAQPWTLMSSYNRINGVWTQEDRDLLTTILRNEWGFRGIVLTDWTARRNTAAQVAAGNDLMMPGNKSQIREIVEKVRSGELEESAVDVCVRRMLELVLKTGSYSGRKASGNPDLSRHARIAREAASEGMVLLKNSGVLPLKEAGTIDLYGNTSYRFIAGGTGSGQVNAAYVVSLKEALLDAGFSLNPYLDRLYNAQLELHDATYADFVGGPFTSAPRASEPSLSRERIFKCAGTGDVAVVTVGRNAGEARDRHLPDDFELSPAETELIRDVCDAYHAAGKKVVVVLNVSGVIETASWKSMPDAILLAWQLGQEGGRAVADALAGTVNPSGKLTMTFPLQYFDHPSSLDFPYDFEGPASFGATMSVTGRKEPLVKDVDFTKYEEGIYVGYRYFTSFGKEVSYPFGYGLSYTTFSYTQPSVKAGPDGLTATVVVTNTGRYAGKEAVQLYVTAPDGGLEKPLLELKAFAKTKLLQPGERQTLTFRVDSYGLASFNPDSSAWETAAGVYNVHFGASVNDIRATLPLKISRPSSWPAHRVMEPRESIQELTKQK
ncbi:MAG: glycoside hydrolase family 3 C-terminal domain-containing protein [Bacteroidales bacterium]|nr:glycoside hydrolase family 3 C-terminal domain-containing protein [Bacteroidales bacterium]